MNLSIVDARSQFISTGYQAKRHHDVHMRQWPDADPQLVMRDIRRRLRSGNTWFWPEPVQLELFD